MRELYKKCSTAKEYLKDIRKCQQGIVKVRKKEIKAIKWYLWYNSYFVKKNRKIGKISANILIVIISVHA